MLIALHQQARTARGHRPGHPLGLVALKVDQTARLARAFPNALVRACPINISRLLTDNGTEFAGQMFGSRARQPSGQHEFDRRYQALGIEHRLTLLPRHPQTNDMGEVFEWERSSLKERFNGTLADPGSVLRTHSLRSSEDPEQTLYRSVTFYNHPLPQKEALINSISSFPRTRESSKSFSQMPGFRVSATLRPERRINQRFQKALNVLMSAQAIQDWYASHPALFHRRPNNRPGRDSGHISISPVQQSKSHIEEPEEDHDGQPIKHKTSVSP